MRNDRCLTVLYSPVVERDFIQSFGQSASPSSKNSCLPLEIATEWLIERARSEISVLQSSRIEWRSVETEQHASNLRTEVTTPATRGEWWAPRKGLLIAHPSEFRSLRVKDRPDCY